MNDIAKIESAIGFIPSIDRSLWVEVGMAVKSELGDSGFPLWDSWSQQAESYKEESAKSVWKSIRECGKITIATLYHHAKAHGWRDDGLHQTLTAAQIKDRRRAAMERTFAADLAADLGHRKAAAKAVRLIKSCVIGTHPYLAAKGFPETKSLITEGGALVIPMRNCITEDLIGAQVVRLVENAWEKKMLPGMRAKCAVLRIGSPKARELWLVEGYATGLSVDAALRLMRLSAAVVVCFSAHNLAHVAGLLSGTRYVVADNDLSGTGEKAAIATGLPYVMPQTLATDANDMHQRDGLMALAKMIKEARIR
jgi:putative DNA primase/helicase